MDAGYPTSMPILNDSDSALTLLDKPIWNALSTEHLRLALGGELARRYPPEIGPLSGIPEQTAECYEALRRLAKPGDVMVLFSLEELQIPAGWTVVFSGQLYQMVRQVRSKLAPLRLENGETMRRLTESDAPAMVALAELTEPGPFRLRTLELGNFYGIFWGKRLVAMAGKRMHLPGLIEVSAVCTHPDARGRGYASMLMSLVIDEIERDRKTAFLHVFTHNPAVRIYESLGFAIRKTANVVALKNDV